jgi:4'-phosphopantetheinyl transferase EntD
MAAFTPGLNPAQLSPQIAALFPPGVAAAELSTALPAAAAVPVWEEERLSIAHAIPERVAEFTAGRLCAHRAIAKLRADDAALPAGEDRAPLWPAGLTGSITHGGGLAAAVVARTEVCRALGLDAEARSEVSAELWPEFCTAPEMQRLGTLAAAQRGWAATLCFAVKEAFYKCQYVLTRAWLDFDAVEIDYEGLLTESGAVRVRIVRPVPALPAAVWSGRFCWRGDLVLAGVAYLG